MKRQLQRVTLACALGACAWAQSAADIDAAAAKVHALYLDLHQSPELSSHETQTAAKVAAQLRALGYTVTEHVGGTGVVALLENGKGPVVMLRTELDGLPVEEKTGLAYASKAHQKNDAGVDVATMHACGHDLHMSSLIATADVMAKNKAAWHGTLMLIAQPAEETIRGAKAMLADGLFTRFPKPNYGVALHVHNELAATMVGVGAGPRYANSDSVRITMYGRGGHGSTPDKTVDPVVMAARTVVALQTIVAREVRPGEPAVVTIGYLHAGTKNNIIPDTAELGITVRTYRGATRKQILAAIERIAKAEAVAANAPREPSFEYPESIGTVYNDPALAARAQRTLEAKLGVARVRVVDPIMGSEDYAAYVEAGVPSFFFALGGVEPKRWAEAQAKGESFPTNHSSLFAPDYERAIHTAVEAEVALLMDLLK